MSQLYASLGFVGDEPEPRVSRSTNPQKVHINLGNLGLLITESSAWALRDGITRLLAETPPTSLWLRKPGEQVWRRIRTGPEEELRAAAEIARVVRRELGQPAVTTVISRDQPEPLGGAG
jgi:hypothetical protein